MRRLFFDGNNMARIAAAGNVNATQERGSREIVFMVMKRILEISSEFETNRIYFAFDHPRNIRKVHYPHYKENRRVKDPRLNYESLYEQINILKDYVLPKLGVHVSYQEGLEADDFMFYLSERFKEADGEKNVIVSTDQDFYQLLPVIDCYSPQTKVLMTRELAEETYDIDMEHWLKIKMIAGDSSDNIKGIKGVGKKTAIKFLKGMLNPNLSKYGEIERYLESGLCKENKILMGLPYPDLHPLNWNPPSTGVTFTKECFMEICREFDFYYFMPPDKWSEWSCLFSNGE